MDRPSHPLLACPTLPGDEHGDRHLGHTANHGNDAANGLAVPDQVFRSATDLESCLQLVVLVLEPLEFKGLPNDLEEPLLIHDRLFEVVIGSRVQGKKRRLGASMGRDQDADHPRVVGLHLGEHLLAGESGHAQVHQGQVDVLLLDDGESLLAGPGLKHLVALPTQLAPQGLSDVQDRRNPRLRFCSRGEGIRHERSVAQKPIRGGHKRYICPAR